MKAKDFSTRLDDLADLIKAAGGDVALLSDFSEILGLLGTERVAEALDRVGPSIVAPAKGEGEFGRIAKFLDAARPFFEATSKKAFLDDIARVSLFATLVGSANLAQLRTAILAKRAVKSPGAKVQSDVVDRYVKDLSEALRDPEAFSRIFARLQADKCVHREEAIEIATQVSGRIARSASKKKALGSIEATHVRRVGAQARREYFRDKSAA